MKDCKVMMGTLYASMGLELVKCGMLTENTWAPKKNLPEADIVDLELLRLWEEVVGIVWGTSIIDMKAAAKKGNAVIDKLADEDRHINQSLLSIHLFDQWAYTMGCASFMVKAKWRTRLPRLKLAVYEGVVRVAGEEAAGNSYIAADNIARHLSGRAMLTGEQRVLVAERLKRRLKI